jgi:hypothetical protein
MDLYEAAQKLKDAGLIARAFVDGKNLWGGTHTKRYHGGNVDVIEGHFSIEVTEHYVMVKVAKGSVEEAIQFLVDNVKPGISDKKPEPKSGVQYYFG